MRKAFTLIELLVVIAIIAILAVVVVLTLNPGQLILQSRDSNRLSDLASLNSALSLYQTDASINGSVNLGSSSILYVSLPDPAATTTAGSNCASLGLPSLPGSYTYHCAASSTFRKVDGSGWIPVNLSSISSGAPLGQLPIDPVNTSSTGNYLTYVVSSTQYMVTALPESQKQKLALAIQPMVSLYPSVMAVGNTQAINPLFSTQGLVGYWPMDEGTSTVALDMSGSGGNGTWSGSTTNGSYYVAGKVGTYAGTFSNTCPQYISVSNAFHPTSSISVSAWVKKIIGSGANYGVIVRSFNDYFMDFASGPTTLRFGFNSNFGQSKSGYPDDGNWHFVAGTYDGSIISYYVDNISLGQISYSATVTNSASYMAMGGYSIGCPNYPSLNGLLDDVRVYSRVLSVSEIQAIYNAGR